MSEMHWESLINSAYRNPAYNIEIGGATNSQHIWGTAADIQLSDFDDDNDTDNDDAIMLRDEAVNQGADYTDIGTNYVHMDWRNDY